MIESDQYHADTSRISKTGLDIIHRSPAHYYARYLDPKREPQRETPALLQGKAIHSAVFEPELFPKEYAVAPSVNRSTKAGKEAYAAFAELNAGKTFIDANTYEICNRINASIRSIPICKDLLSVGVAEQRVDFDWSDGETIVPAKTKPDWNIHGSVLVDLKTTDDARANAFGKSVYKYRYHVQGAFYSDAMAANNGGDVPDQFIFIAVEKQAPFAVAVYYLTREQIELGRYEYEQDILLYHKCKTNNSWPGYDAQAQPVEMPAWALR